MKTRTLTPALVALLLVPAVASPQVPQPPGPGARVRISAPGLRIRRLAGTLEDTVGGFWTLALDGGRSVTIGRTEITEVEPAAELQRPAPRVRVRISAPSRSVLKQAGVLVDTTGGVWTFKGDRWLAPRELEPAEVTELEVSAARHGNAGKGALIGLGAGVGLGALSGFLAGDDPPCSEFDWTGVEPGLVGVALLGAFAYSLECSMRMTAGEKAALGAVGGGLTGLLIGVVLGAVIRTDVWAPVAVSPEARAGSAPGVSFAPVVTSDRRFGVGLRIPTR